MEQETTAEQIIEVNKTEILGKIKFPVRYNPDSMNIIDAKNMVLFDAKLLPEFTRKNNDTVTHLRTTDIMGELFAESFNEKYSDVNKG